jgi:hypothetical protein
MVPMKIAICRVLPGRRALTDTRVYSEGETFDYDLPLATRLRMHGDIEILRTRDKADGRSDARLITAGTKSMLAADRMEVARFNRGRW